MKRSLAFDITHLVSRLPIAHPSGIDKVDMAYACHYAALCDTAVHYGLSKPRFHDRSALEQLSALATASRWTGMAIDQDPAFAAVRAALTGQRPVSPPRQSQGYSSGKTVRRLEQIRWRLKRSARHLPTGSLYLNVAQHVFEYPRFFRWLDDRPDIKTVMLIHDFLPLDYPEYFLPGYRTRFSARVDTIIKYARAIITTSSYVRERVEQERNQRGLPPIPIHVQPLPSSLSLRGTDREVAMDQELSRVPYFVILGTIEPRKNHLLLLNIWRRLAEEHSAVPKLVVVGTRGWENEQVIDVLDRSLSVRPHVIECAGLSDHGLQTLLANSRGLLMPSFAEGYGLPVIEALTAGAPVVASDIPVFREVSQGSAILLSPIDGIAWRDTILALVDQSHPTAQKARAVSGQFTAPTWSSYFAGVDAFLTSL